jgi:preprotein translocase subunit YajC
MQKEHQALIDQYKKNEKILERSGIKTVVLEVLMIGIVCL